MTNILGLYKAISEGVISMSKKIHEFNDIIRKLRKELFGKGPERIHTVFVENMAVSTLYGNLSASMYHLSSFRRAGDKLLACTQISV